MSFNDWSTVLPGAILQATLSDAGTKVLQAPQLRSVDGQKSSMKIGEKEPTASGSFANTNAGISPLVNTQFTYLDVGVNVEIMPHVHENGDVSLHVTLDISSVTGQVNLGGVNEPVIGQRKIDQDIRLREGEVNLIGGLLSTQDNKTKTGVPGLANIPLLGRFFSGTSVDRERDEVMIALVPHVVRRPDITAENSRSIDSGSLNQVTVRRGPPPVEESPAPPATAPPEPIRIHFPDDKDTVDANVDSEIIVLVEVENAREAASAPLLFQYDPKLLCVERIMAGTRAVASGRLLTVTLKALAPGAATFSAANIALNASQDQAVGSGSPKLTINIK